MSINSIEFNSTSSPKPETLDFADSAAAAMINTFGAVVAVLGCVKNYLSFQSAAYLPEATSKYLMRYLAVWDSIAALEATTGRFIIYIFIIFRSQVAFTDIFLKP